MYLGRTVFSQLMDFAPQHEFRRLVEHHEADYRLRHFSCWDQFLCMAFAQLTYRESLRDIEACLRAAPSLYHLGIRSRLVARSTLADANERRTWRLYADFAQLLIATARSLYSGDSFGVELDHTVYALDSTIIDLCLSLCPWARFRHGRGAVKLHTLLDLRGSIPSVIRITPARIPDIRMLDHLVYEPGAFYVMDRGYVDFKRLRKLHQAGAFFVTRSWSNTRTRCLDSRPLPADTAIAKDDIVQFTGVTSRHDFPAPARRICLRESLDVKPLVFLTNHLELPALTIADLYRCRWHIELFFKWIKQHLRIKAFYGWSQNAVKTQIWIAITVYLLVAIACKRLQLGLSFHSLLQVLSLTLFEKTPISDLVLRCKAHENDSGADNQFKLFEF
jgi:hypothetical protein